MYDKSVVSWLVSVCGSVRCPERGVGSTSGVDGCFSGLLPCEVGGDNVLLIGSCVETGDLVAEGSSVAR